MRHEVSWPDMSLDNPFHKGIMGINRLLRPVDTLFEPREPFQSFPPLFILGAPRSGSTLTYQVITQYFRVGYMTVPLAYVHGLANLVCRLLRPWFGRPAAVFESSYGHVPGLLAPSEHAHFWYQWFPEDKELGHYHDPEMLNLDAYTELQRSLDSLAAILGRPWVFKNLYLSMSAGALSRVLPQARFLLVKRDPLMVYQSVLRGRECRAGAGWWSVKPPHYREWLPLPLWQQVVRQVFYADAIPRRDLQRYAPGRFLEIEYSELCRDPYGCMQQLQNWLAPIGYEPYSDSAIPREFTVSDKLYIDHAQLQMVSDEFRLLRQQFDVAQV